MGPTTLSLDRVYEGPAMGSTTLSFGPVHMGPVTPSLSQVDEGQPMGPTTLSLRLVYKGTQMGRITPRHGPNPNPSLPSSETFHFDKLPLKLLFLQLAQLNNHFYSTD